MLQPLQPQEPVGAKGLADVLPNGQTSAYTATFLLTPVGCVLCCRVWVCASQLGHCPQEDYPEAIQDTLEAFLQGETDSWPMGKVVASKMTKRGVVDA